VTAATLPLWSPTRRSCIPSPLGKYRLMGGGGGLVAPAVAGDGSSTCRSVGFLVITALSPRPRLAVSRGACGAFCRPCACDEVHVHVRCDANRHPGLYSDVIPIDGAYPSASYWDDLAWGALWLHKATGSVSYLNDARSLWSQHLASPRGLPLTFDWGIKDAGVALLLAQQVQPWANAAPYRAALDQLLTRWRPKGQVKYVVPAAAWLSCRKPVLVPRCCVGSMPPAPTTTATSSSSSSSSSAPTPTTPTRYVKGLATVTGWGSLAAALNVAFLACVYADKVLSVPGSGSAGSVAARAVHTDWARTQLLFALGSSGRSYMVGFGAKWPKVRTCVGGLGVWESGGHGIPDQPLSGHEPRGCATSVLLAPVTVSLTIATSTAWVLQRPQHPAASCRIPPAPCDWSDFERRAANPHVLVGALVGGPDKQGR
jgi:hypothetical protein